MSLDFRIDALLRVGVHCGCSEGFLVGRIGARVELWLLYWVADVAPFTSIRAGSASSRYYATLALHGFAVVSGVRGSRCLFTVGQAVCVGSGRHVCQM